MIRKLLKALVIAAGVGAFPGMKLETVARKRMTPATTVMMMPRITRKIDTTTFRAWAVPKALRPRITKMAPTKTRRKPMIPMYGIQPMSVPMRRSRTPVFVRPICFCRSASQGDGSPGIAPGYMGAAGAPGPAPTDKALPQFTQNMVPGAFAAPQRGHVTLPANHDPLRPAMRESIEKDFEAGQGLIDVCRWAGVDGPGPLDRWISLELGRLNSGLVVETKSLTRLLGESDPACCTREGDLHPFDPQALARFASVLTREEADALRLPLTLRVRGDSDEAILTDELGAKALRAVEKFDQAFRFRGRPDGSAALPGHRPRAPPRRRAPARLRLSLLRRLGLLAARRGRP